MNRDETEVKWPAILLHLTRGLRFSDNTVLVPFHVRNYGVGNVRGVYATLTQRGYRTHPIFGIERLTSETETAVEAPIFFHDAACSYVENEFVFRIHFNDDRAENQTVERCYRLSETLGSTDPLGWELRELSDCSFDA
jgi:hypothetical protein